MLSPRARLVAQYKMQKDYAKAAEMCRTAMEGNAEAFGEHHKATVKNAEFYAEVLELQERHEEATQVRPHGHGMPRVAIRRSRGNHLRGGSSIAGSSSHGATLSSSAPTTSHSRACKPSWTSC